MIDEPEVILDDLRRAQPLAKSPEAELATSGDARPAPLVQMPSERFGVVVAEVVAESSATIRWSSLAWAPDVGASTVTVVCSHRMRFAIVSAEVVDSGCAGGLGRVLSTGARPLGESLILTLAWWVSRRRAHVRRPVAISGH